MATDSSPFSVPFYFLYFHFQSAAGCCVDVRNETTLLALKPTILNLQNVLPSSLDLNVTLLLNTYVLYIFSVNSPDYVKFFDYWTYKVEYILSHFPYAKISIQRDFNVHHQLWLSFSFND